MYREFRSAVGACVQVDIPNFLVKGPRTAMWCFRFILEHGGTPMGRHAKFKSDAGLTAADPGVITHEHLMKYLQAALCVDQLDGTNSATVELICREAQMIEDKYSDKLRTKSEFGEESEYFMKTDLGQPNVMMCPALKTWVAERVREDAAILKERRKACEERQLLQGGFSSSGGPKGGGKADKK